MCRPRSCTRLQSIRALPRRYSQIPNWHRDARSGQKAASCNPEVYEEVHGLGRQVVAPNTSRITCDPPERGSRKHPAYFTKTFDIRTSRRQKDSSLWYSDTYFYVLRYTYDNTNTNPTRPMCTKNANPGPLRLTNTDTDDRHEALAPG